MIHIFRKAASLRPLSATSSARRAYSDKEDNNKPDKKQPKANKTESSSSSKTKPASVGGQNRLNELLASMSTDSTFNLVKTVVAPKPKPANQKKNANRKDDEPRKSITVEEAAHDVAQTIGGDVQKTESELLAKLLKRSPDAVDVPINDLISGMQIDGRGGGDSRSEHPKTRAQFVRRSVGHHQQRPPRRNEGESVGGRVGGGGGGDGDQQRERFQRRVARTVEAGSVVSVNLFGEKPLGIFKPLIDSPSSVDVLSTWSALQQRELNLAVTHPPSNHFQKMALWTEQGKLWKFPINNEQGLDAEAAICFTEHIFLDRHLEDWCPTRGPVRHFMELVCVGLSKNPYYTVQQKIDHINWFREYFAEKKELLDQVIVQGDQPAGESVSVQAN